MQLLNHFENRSNAIIVFIQQTVLEDNKSQYAINKNCTHKRILHNMKLENKPLVVCMMKCKKISNDQELIQSDPISCPSKPKGKKLNTLTDNSLRKARAVNRMNSSSRQMVIQLPKYVANIIGEPTYKFEQQEKVILRTHNRSTALERSVLKYWVGRWLEPVLRVSKLTLSFYYSSKHIVSCSVRVNVF